MLVPQPSPAMNIAASVTAPAGRRIRCRLVGLVAFAFALPVHQSGAQSPPAAASDTVPERLVLFSLGGGFAKASSTPRSNSTQGYSLQATASLRTPIPLLRLRADGLFGDAGVTQLKAFTGSALLSAPNRWAVAPYVMAGGGAYAEQGDRMTAGWNVGAGFSVEMGRKTRLFMEARMHAYRDPFYGQPYIVPGGVVNDRHPKYSYLYQPLTFGFRS